MFQPARSIVAALCVVAVALSIRVAAADPPAPDGAADRGAAAVADRIDPIEVRARDNWEAADDRRRIFQALDLPEDTFAGAHGLTLSPKRGEIAPHPDLEAMLARFADRHVPADHRIVGMLYLGSFGGPDMGVITEHGGGHHVILMDDPRRYLPIQIAHLPGRTPSNDLLLVTFITHGRDARNPADPDDRRPNLPRCIALRRAGVAVITELDLLVPIKAAVDKLPRGGSSPVRDPRLAEAGLSLIAERDAGDRITLTIRGDRAGVDPHAVIDGSMRLVGGDSREIAIEDLAVGPDLIGEAGDAAPTAQLRLSFPVTALGGLNDAAVRLRFHEPAPTAEPDAAAPAQPPDETRR
jgi:hypothetical protein